MTLLKTQPRTSGHLFCEEHDHLCEVNGSRGLGEHALGLTVGDGLADGGEGGDDVGGGQETVLVCVHDTEGFLELLDLPLAEEGEDVGATLLSLSVIAKNIQLISFMVINL